MSSPIRDADDADAPLRYAPPWLRRRSREMASADAMIGQARSRQQLVTSSRGSGGDLAMAKLQRQLALNPDAVPEPPLEDGESLWPLALRIIAVATVAALVAWLVISLPGARLLRNGAKSAQAASITLTAESSDQNAARLRRPPLLESRRAETVPPDEATTHPDLAAAEVLAASSNEPPRSTQLASATPEPVSAGAASSELQPASPSSAGRAISGQGESTTVTPDEMALLLKRSQDFLSNGDLASARLLLRRATEAGSAEAAVALGATYDPLVFRQLGTVGAAPDPAQARSWYQKALSLGSADAAKRLANLTQAYP